MSIYLVTAASEIDEAFLEGMNTFTAQMKEAAKSQLPIIIEDGRFDKPVLRTRPRYYHLGT